MSDSSDEDSGGFRINEAYASKYNDWRRKEELQKLKSRYGEDAELDVDSSSSESEDEDAEALTPQLEEDWLRTLAALKSKDPRIYDKNAKFYHSDEEKSDSNPKESGMSKKKNKPVYLKDYHRKVILEKEGIISEEESDENEVEISHEPGYYEEQEEIKRSLQAKLAEESDSDGELFTKKSKTTEQEEEEERDYIKWLKDQKNLEEKDPVGVELAPLKTYWNDPKLNANEKFLRDLILNKGYIDKDGKRVPSYSEIVDDGEGFSEEEEILDREDQFERKYNFRYEEPDPDFIKSYPRTIKDTLRQKDTKRSEKRRELKKRKEMEKQKVKEEIKQLKNLKRREIMDRIDKLREITGNPALDFQEDDLETDFDPQKHDEMMQKYFDDEFYKMEDGEQKPEAPAEIEDLLCENWDEWTGGEEMEEHGEEYNDNDEDHNEKYEPHVDDPDFCMDDDYDPTKIVSRKKKKKRSKFHEAVTSSKPTFDPKEKTFEEYFEEYYKLDYEDIVAGQPCRFKYRNVTPNSYGLQVDEILKCRDRELNAWVSVKKMSQYRSTDEEDREVKVFESKGRNERKKMNILPSLKEEPDDQLDKKGGASSIQNTSPKKKKRKLPETEIIESTKTTKKYKVDTMEIKIETTTSNQSKGEGHSFDSGSIEKNVKSGKKRKMMESKVQREKKRIDSESKKSDSENSEAVKKNKKKKRCGDKESSVLDVFHTDAGDRLLGGTNDSESHKSPTEKSQESQVMSTDSVSQQGETGIRKKRKNKKKKKGGPLKLSSERLLAFGINPKKVKYMNFNRFKEDTQN
ncbi:protein KRI1 homolog isoform X2 [Ostrea edulis]|uniref:protein KRI1 homolog isoform X2 n=1 Tax=Ostrea edulis TaxID=37623 RepID=UPI0024AFF66F|nr:protein KRI1 homolog isoform X2 [Ostrea edulis]